LFINLIEGIYSLPLPYDVVNQGCTESLSDMMGGGEKWPVKADVLEGKSA
jgi:hypothetical protein